MNYKFRPDKNLGLTREMLSLRLETNAPVGFIEYGGQKLSPVLKLNETTFVHSHRLDNRWKTIAEMNSIDIHSAQNHKDVVDISARNRALNGKNKTSD